ncbi:hypothetical protein IQ07DRAFT_660285 [Pyrenochaeta sp. DS3sAY3a]|nr:hypothetical protein IQ07DRAFT_660285 [Pyrenochaeta sp. DS3sAY3a]
MASESAGDTSHSVDETNTSKYTLIPRPLSEPTDRRSALDTKEKFGFLSLPGELRNQIYDYLILPGTIICDDNDRVCYHTSCLGQWFSDTPFGSGMRSAATLMHTCRQIHDEMATLPFRKNEIMGEAFEMHQLLNQLSDQQAAGIRQITLVIRQKTFGSFYLWGWGFYETLTSHLELMPTLRSLYRCINLEVFTVMWVVEKGDFRVPEYDELWYAFDDALLNVISNDVIIEVEIEDEKFGDVIGPDGTQITWAHWIPPQPRHLLHVGPPPVYPSIEADT